MYRGGEKGRHLRLQLVEKKKKMSARVVTLTTLKQHSRHSRRQPTAVLVGVVLTLQRSPWAQDRLQKLWSGKFQLEDSLWYSVAVYALASVGSRVTLILSSRSCVDPGGDVSSVGIHQGID